jgi:hypothetical protein
MGVVVTPEVIDGIIARAELRGDWDDVEILKVLRDRLLQFEAQNQAYRHALSGGVSINLVAKRHWLKGK